jgi:hypothetical protein
MIRGALLGVLVLFSGIRPAASQALRSGVSAGMGITYTRASDAVDLVNSTQGALERVGEFNTGVEFFGAFSFPLGEEWMLKLEYGYQIESLNIATAVETAQFTITQHCPTVILQRVLAQEGLFNIKAGAGLGYHFGTLAAKYLYIDDQFTGSGPGMILELEGNTALGEQFFVHLGLNGRWELIGRLSDSLGRSPGLNAAGEQTTLNSFGVGARLGFTYYLF